MAFIHNIKTAVTTECLNKDVIKICKKDPLNYKVADSLEELNIEKDEASDKEIKKPLSKMKVDELKKVATELKIEGIDSLTKDELVVVIKQKQNG